MSELKTKILDQIMAIKPIDSQWVEKTQSYVDNLVKPVGSLGKLETLAIQLASIQKVEYPKINKKVTIVMAADNGVVKHGVASTPIEMTWKVALCMAKNEAGISALSKGVEADVSVYDIGINWEIKHPNLKNVKIKYGTEDFLEAKAMTDEEVYQALDIGIQAVKDHIVKGYNLFGTGEMGIGNTTTSSGIIMALTGVDVDKAVGKGAGLSDQGLDKKKAVISQGLEKHQLLGINKSIKGHLQRLKDSGEKSLRKSSTLAISNESSDLDDPYADCFSTMVEVLSSIGGLDIGGLVGVFLGAAIYEVPVVIDGVISAAAALCAYCINPKVKDYMIASHCSMEPAYLEAVNYMGLDPMFNLDMRLGEGTGCPIAFSVIEIACHMIGSMLKFEDIDIDDSYMIDLRNGV